jgi:SAM-dependent methyltransferase
VVAVDDSAAMIDLARRRLGARAEVVQADLNHPLPFDASSFDLVLCALVIHHVPDRAACLREFNRLLRPGGHVVLSTHHPTADWLRKGGSYFDVKEEEDTWHRDEASYRVRFWREPLTSLCAAMTESGFLVERLVELLPAPSMREHSPDHWEKLQREPGFIAFRLLKPAAPHA